MKNADKNRGLLKVLLYGKPGSTKTRTAASATFVPEMSPVLILEQAANPLSIRDYDPQPVVITMQSMKDYNQPYDWFMRGQPEEHGFANWLRENGLWLDEPFKTIVLDGISEAQRFALKAVRPEMDKLPGDVPPFTEQRDFGGVLAMMTNWAYKYIQIPNMHVILTALEYEKEDEAGAIYRRPMLWGQTEGMVSSYAYMVMRLTSAEYMDSRTKAVVATELDKVKAARTIGFVKHAASFYAKDQYGAGFDHMYDPTMQKIFDCVYRNGKANGS